MSQSFLSFGNSILSFGNYILGGESTGPTMPQYTVRFKFDDTSYDPTASGETWKSGSSWTRVSSEPNVWDYYHASDNWLYAFDQKFTSGNYVHILHSNLTGVLHSHNLFKNCLMIQTANVYGGAELESCFDGCTHLTDCTISSYSGTAQNMFYGCTALTNCTLNNFSPTSTHAMFSGATALVTAPDFDCANVTSASNMFYQCSALTTVPSYNMGTSLTNMSAMFSRCTSLASVPSSLVTSNVTNMAEVCRGTLITATPAWDTAKVLTFENAFASCSELVSIGTFDVTAVDNVNSMFAYCRKVAGGALALYTQLSTRTVPPSTYTDCFRNCGSSTTTGAAELAQIPTTWGGTMAV